MQLGLELLECGGHRVRLYVEGFKGDFKRFYYFASPVGSIADETAFFSPVSWFSCELKIIAIENYELDVTQRQDFTELIDQTRI